MRSTKRKAVLVTGAAGFVARCILPRLQEHYRLRLLDNRPIEKYGDAEVVEADIRSLDEMLAACEGMDTVVHLAAEPGMNAPFERLLEPNIIGAYTVFEAARQVQCSRLIFASSINTVKGYGPGTSVTWNMPVNPINLYGATKCFGEALARYYAHQGLSAVCVRIGQIRRQGDSFENKPSDPYNEAWISDRDLANLFDLCIRTENIAFAIVHGLGRHEFPRLSMAHTSALLGFEPLDGSI
ncbi:MAG: NAD(P)-dependent oxidoreductase [Pseudomonadota bacterium]